MTFQQLAPDQLKVLDKGKLSLFSPFRRGTGFSEKEQEAIFFGQLQAGCEAGGEAWGYEKGGVLLAIAALLPLPHDSTFFGMRMGRLVIAVAKEIESSQLLSLITYVLERARATYRHLCAEVDVDDYTVFNALSSHGFSLLDIKRTYYARRLREDMDLVRYQHSLRPYRASDYERVMEIVAQADFSSRFSRDVSLPQHKVKAFKEQWFSSILNKPKQERLALVFERKGRVEACGVVDETDFSSLGVPRKIMLGGLYASTMAGTGGYVPLLHRLILQSIERHGVGGTTVSLNNTPTIRVLESFRSYSGSVMRNVLCLHLI